MYYFYVSLLEGFNIMTVACWLIKGNIKIFGEIRRLDKSDIVFDKII